MIIYEEAKNVVRVRNNNNNEKKKQKNSNYE